MTSDGSEDSQPRAERERERERAERESGEGAGLQSESWAPRRPETTVAKRWDTGNTYCIFLYVQ